MTWTDALYAELIAAHDGLDPQASAALNRRLVLLFGEAVGDAERVRAIIAEARGEREGGDLPGG